MNATCGATQSKDWGSEANYDLNVWNETAWVNDDEVNLDTDEWLLVAYRIATCGCTLSDGDEIATLRVTAQEAKELTLGVSEDDGGDYTYDSDFWLDKYGFLDTYKNIPFRIKEWLYNLPPYTTNNTH